MAGRAKGSSIGGGGHSELSYDSRRPPSETASQVSQVTIGSTKRSGHVTASLDVAENPLCPRIRGLCCLILLFNLAVILVCLGFVVVCQLFEPAFVWWIGLFLLVFGFVTLVGCFIYCFVICNQHKAEMAEAGDEAEMRRTHHWSKTMSFGEVNYDNERGRPTNQ